MAKILLIDNDPQLNLQNSKLLQSKGYDVFIAQDSVIGAKKILELKPQLIICEVHLEKDTSGFELLYQLRSNNKSSRFFAIHNTAFIVLTKIHNETNFHFSYSDEQSYLPKLSGIFSKPIEDDVLLEAVEKSLEV